MKKDKPIKEITAQKKQKINPLFVQDETCQQCDKRIGSENGLCVALDEGDTPIYCNCCSHCKNKCYATIND